MTWQRRSAPAPRKPAKAYEDALRRAEGLSRGQRMDYIETTISELIQVWGAYRQNMHYPDNLRAAAHSSRQLCALLEAMDADEPNLIPPARPTADLAVAQAIKG